jgi:hypothetical protein
MNSNWVLLALPTTTPKDTTLATTHNSELRYLAEPTFGDGIVSLMKTWCCKGGAEALGRGERGGLPWGGGVREGEVRETGQVA